MDLGISATEYLSLIRNGEVSAEEFTAKTLDRIHAVENKVHAYITIDEENALKRQGRLTKK